MSASLYSLPLEILYEIVTLNPETWKSAVLSIPFVYRLFSCERIKRKFTMPENFKRGCVDVTRYTLCGKLHRENGPALIEIDKDMKTESHYKHGLLHREDGPAVISYRGEEVFMEEWYRKGKFHRENGPAIVYRDSCNNSSGEAWYRKGKMHREDGPAKIDYMEYLEGRFIVGEGWYLKGIEHREEGPADIDIDYDDEIIRETWYSMGEIRRYMERKFDGEILYEDVEEM